MVRHIRYLLKSIFTEAVEQGYLTRSPVRRLLLPIVKSVSKPFLTEDEIKKLLARTQGRDRLLLRLVLTTALRPSELFALRWSCFQPQKNLLLITESVYRGKLRPFTKTTDSDSRQNLLKVFLPSILVNELQKQQKRSGRRCFHLSKFKWNADGEGKLSASDFDAARPTGRDTTTELSDFETFVSHTFTESWLAHRHCRDFEAYETDDIAYRVHSDRR